MLYAICASQFVGMIFQTRSTLAIENILLLFTHHYPETYKPKFHCRRQSGMNFGCVTVNGVNSNNILSVQQCVNIKEKINYGKRM